MEKTNRDRCRNGLSRCCAKEYRGGVSSNKVTSWEGTVEPVKGGIGNTKLPALIGLSNLLWDAHDGFPKETISVYSLARLFPWTLMTIDC